MHGLATGDMSPDPLAYRCVPNFSEFGQFAAKLQRFKDWKFGGRPHLEFYGKWGSMIARSLQNHSWPTFTPKRMGRGLGEMSWSTFQAEPRTQSLIYVHAGSLHELGDATYFPGPNFRGKSKNAPVSSIGILACIKSSHSHSHFWHICVPVSMGFL